MRVSAFENLRSLRGRLLLGATLALAACDGPVDPEREDPPPTPYRLTPRGVRVNGVSRVLVIPTLLAGGAAPTISPEQLRLQLFGDRDDGVTSRTYGLASNGKFALRGDVASWVQTSLSFNSLNVDTLVVQSIQLADAQLDFGRYDSDGPDGLPNSGDDDGVVDGGIALVIPELDRGCPGPGIHPFAVLNWGTGTGTPREPFRTSDPSASGGTIGVRGYTIMSATDCVGGKANAAPLTHELGHLLFGITDLYHQVPNVPVPANELWRGRRWVVGCWELMAAGSGWGCGSGPPTFPRFNATFGAWARAEIGWVVPREVPTDVEESYELLSLEQGGTVLSLALGSQERVLIEYRQRTAGDVAIPGDGVLMYHIVDTLPFRPTDPNAPPKYRVMLIEADGDGALVRTDGEGGNRGVAGDAFGNGVNELTPVLHPAAVKADGNLFPFRVHSIVLDRSRGRATLSIARFP